MSAADSLTAAERERLGLSDTSDPAVRDTLELAQFVLERGGGRDEVIEAVETGTLGPLALDLALREGAPTLPFAEAVRHAGVDPEEAAALWQALGFPDPRGASLRLSEGEARVLGVLAAIGGSLLGEDEVRHIARVMGGSLATLAEALVDAFRVNVEVPQREGGAPYSEIVRRFFETASTSFPALTEAIDNVFKGHVVSVARGAWSVDEEQATITRDRAVGFADLVGYTTRTRELSPGALAMAIERFGSCAAEVIARHGGRLVKLIGDEAMFVAEDADSAGALALDLVRVIEADGHLPQVRVGLAAGPVVALHGDYYGDVVNLASRLVRAARPQEVLISEGLKLRLDDRFGVDAQPAQAMKGYEDSVVTYRLTAPPGV